MSPLKRIFIVLVVASLGGLSAVVVTACGEDDIVGDDDERVEISLTERDLSPGRVEVRPGEIEFVVENDGNRVHAFAVETPDGIERTKDLEPGETETVTVNLPDGKYKMYDPLGDYRARGVRGTVVVTSDDTSTVRERTVTERTVEEEPPEGDEPPVTVTEREREVQPPPRPRPQRPPPPPPPAPAPEEAPVEPTPTPPTSP